MIKYVPIILICHSSIAEENCKQEYKDTTTIIGESQNSPMSCLIEGQTRVAGLVFAPKIGEPYYVKIKCVPKIIKD